MAQFMPLPKSTGTLNFTGKNALQFIEQYERICLRY